MEGHNRGNPEQAPGSAKPHADLVYLHGRFLSSLKALGRSPATLLAYRSDFLTLIDFLSGTELGLFQRGTMITYPEWLAQGERRWSTIRRHLAGLVTFGDWLVDRDHVALNPMRGVQRPKGQRPMPKPVPTLQADALLALAGDCGRPVLALMRYAGLRVSEVVALEFDDIQPTHICIRHGKGGVPAAVPMAHPLQVALAAWLYKRGPEAGQLFPGITAEWIRKALVKYCALLTFPRYTPHQLRHTFGTELVRANVPLSHVQKLMRHANSNTTIGYVLVEASDLQTSIGNTWGNGHISLDKTTQAS